MNEPLRFKETSDHSLSRFSVVYYRFLLSSRSNFDCHRVDESLQLGFDGVEVEVKVRHRSGGMSGGAIAYIYKNAPAVS